MRFIKDLQVRNDFNYIQTERKSLFDERYPGGIRICEWLKINDESEELYFPIFSSIDEATDNYRKNFSWINLSLDDCIRFVRGNEKCIGLVLDAFTKPVVITDKILDALESILKERRKKENNK